MDSIHSVERYVRNYVYPKIKFFSDTDEDYDQPDFVGDEGKKKQTVTVCNKILQSLGKSHYSITQKVKWWVAYRKIIKRKLSKLRHADVRALQMEFVEGDYIVLHYSVLFVMMPFACQTTISVLYRFFVFIHTFSNT